MRDPRGQVFDEECGKSLAFEEEALSLPIEEGDLHWCHMNHYTKLLTDLANVDVMIEDEDKALLLLSSLSDEEYETFVLTLINGKTSFSYSEVTATLVNYQL